MNSASEDEDESYLTSLLSEKDAIVPKEDKARRGTSSTGTIGDRKLWNRPLLLGRSKYSKFPKPNNTSSSPECESTTSELLTTTTAFEKKQQHKAKVFRSTSMEPLPKTYHRRLQRTEGATGDVVGFCTSKPPRLVSDSALTSSWSCDSFDQSRNDEVTADNDFDVFQSSWRAAKNEVAGFSEVTTNKCLTPTSRSTKASGPFQFYAPRAIGTFDDESQQQIDEEESGVGEKNVQQDTLPTTVNSNHNQLPEKEARTMESSLTAGFRTLSSSAGTVVSDVAVQNLEESVLKANVDLSNPLKQLPQEQEEDQYAGTIPESYIGAILKAFGGADRKEIDLYEDVFNINRQQFTEQQLRIAYFRRGRNILLSEPNKNEIRENDDSLAERKQTTKKAKQKFQAITMAFEILTKPHWKEIYDKTGFGCGCGCRTGCCDKNCSASNGEVIRVGCDEKEQGSTKSKIDGRIDVSDTAADKIEPLIQEDDDKVKGETDNEQPCFTDDNTSRCTARPYSLRSVTSTASCGPILRQSSSWGSDQAKKRLGPKLRWNEQVEEVVFKEHPDERLFKTAPAPWQDNVKDEDWDVSDDEDLNNGIPCSNETGEKDRRSGVKKAKKGEKKGSMGVEATKAPQLTQSEQVLCDEKLSNIDMTSRYVSNDLFDELENTLEQIGTKLGGLMMLALKPKSKAKNSSKQEQTQNASDTSRIPGKVMPFNSEETALPEICVGVDVKKDGSAEDPTSYIPENSIVDSECDEGSRMMIPDRDLITTPDQSPNDPHADYLERPIPVSFTEGPSDCRIEESIAQEMFNDLVRPSKRIIINNEQHQQHLLSNPEYSGANSVNRKTLVSGRRKFISHQSNNVQLTSVASSMKETVKGVDKDPVDPCQIQQDPMGLVIKARIKGKSNKMSFPDTMTSGEAASKAKRSVEPSCHSGVSTNASGLESFHDVESNVANRVDMHAVKVSNFDHALSITKEHVCVGDGGTEQNYNDGTLLSSPISVIQEDVGLTNSLTTSSASKMGDTFRVRNKASLFSTKLYGSKDSQEEKDHTCEENHCMQNEHLSMATDQFSIPTEQLSIASEQFSMSSDLHDEQSTQYMSKNDFCQDFVRNTGKFITPSGGDNVNYECATLETLYNDQLYGVSSRSDSIAADKRESSTKSINGNSSSEPDFVAMVNACMTTVAADMLKLGNQLNNNLEEARRIMEDSFGIPDEGVDQLLEVLEMEIHPDCHRTIVEKSLTY